MTVPAILAAGVDPGAIIAIIFGLISFIGWIVNQVNSAQKAPPPPRKRAPRDRSIQDEIDKFLSERETPPAAEQRNRETPIPRKAPEPRPQPPRKAPAPAQTTRPLQQQKPRPKANGNGNGGNRPQPKSPQPGRTVADAPAAPISNRGPALGAQVTQHLAEAMAPRIGQAVQQDLPHAVQQSVDRHLGKTRTISGRPGGEAGGGSAALIVAMLKKPETVRAAIILNEVLAPPPSMRRKRVS